MLHSFEMPTDFPWRTATIVVAAIASVELAALITIGAVQLAPTHHTTAAKKTAKTSAARHARPRIHVRPAPSHPLRSRTDVRVLVLNGNGVSGAAGAEAQRLRVRGYRIAGAANAQRHDYARSMVMFVPGWLKEARRLAHDTGVRMVSPIDGMRPRQLKGSKIVLLLGT